VSPACADRRGDIAAYIVGALDGEERTRMVTHLRQCASCQAEYNELALVRGWLNRLTIEAWERQGADLAGRSPGCAADGPPGQ